MSSRMPTTRLPDNTEWLHQSCILWVDSDQRSKRILWGPIQGREGSVLPQGHLTIYSEHPNSTTLNILEADLVPVQQGTKLNKSEYHTEGHGYSPHFTKASWSNGHRRGLTDTHDWKHYLHATWGSLSRRLGPCEVRHTYENIIIRTN